MFSITVVPHATKDHHRRRGARQRDAYRVAFVEGRQQFSTFSAATTYEDQPEIKKSQILLALVQIPVGDTSNQPHRSTASWERWWLFLGAWGWLL
jgi:hypothetical protein